MPRTVPVNYAFVNYTDMDSMHDTSTYSQIRKHAMKQVGAAKRKPRGRNKTVVELFWVPIASDETGSVNDNQTKLLGLAKAADVRAHSRRIVDDRALYNSFIRSLSCKMDPFESASVTLDVTSRELLQYFIFFASRCPNTWTYSSSALLPSAPGEHRESVYRTVGSALQDTLLGKCLLATAAARTHSSSVGRDDSLRFKQKDLALTQESLYQLRARIAHLQDGNSEAVEPLVACMQHLGGAAFYRGDFATARTHIKAAIVLAQRIGGVRALRDPYTRGRIISFDDLISCVEVRPCFLGDEFDPGDRLPSNLEHSGQGLVAELSACRLICDDCPVIPPKLKVQILQIIRYQAARHRYVQSKYVSTFETLVNRQWLALRLLAIRNRLLALEISERRANIVKLAILMWTLLPAHRLSQDIVGNVVAPRLQDLLQEVSCVEWTGCGDVRLWCLLIGYCCSPETTELSEWFAEEISWQLQSCTASIIGDSSNYEDLIAFQRQFLYNEPVQEPATRKLVIWLSLYRRYPRKVSDS